MNKVRIAALAAVVIVGAACSSTATGSKDAGGQSKADSPVIPTTQAAAAKTEAAKTEAAKQTGPWTSFGDGVYEVGDKDGQVAPGKYKTTVPDNSFGCYWEREKDTSGEFSSIIANGNANKGQPVVVTIAKSDGAFKTQRCGTWTKA